MDAGWPMLSTLLRTLTLRNDCGVAPGAIHLRGCAPACGWTVVILAVIAISIHLLSARRAGERMSTAIHIEPSALQLGEIWGQSEVTCKLPITNNSPETITIDDWKTSCGCGTVSPSMLRIEPWQTGNVNLAIKLSAADANTREATEFRVALFPTIRVNELSRKVFEVSGKLRAPCIVVPSMVQFPHGSLVKGRPFPTRHVTVEMLAPASTLTADWESSFAEVAVTKASDETYTVAIKPNENLAVGAHRFRVILYVRHSHEVAEQTLLIEVDAKVADTIRFEPDGLVFGVVTVSDYVEDIVNIKSADDETFEVISVDVSSRQLRVDRVDENAYKIALTPSQPGQFNERVLFKVRDTHSDEVKERNIELPVAYNTIAE